MGETWCENMALFSKGDFEEDLGLFKKCRNKKRKAKSPTYLSNS